MNYLISEWINLLNNTEDEKIREKIYRVILSEMSKKAIQNAGVAYKRIEVIFKNGMVCVGPISYVKEQDSFYVFSKLESEKENGYFYIPTLGIYSITNNAIFMKRGYLPEKYFLRLDGSVFGYKSYSSEPELPRSALGSVDRIIGDIDGAKIDEYSVDIEKINKQLRVTSRKYGWKGIPTTGIVQPGSSRKSRRRVLKRRWYDVNSDNDKDKNNA